MRILTAGLALAWTLNAAALPAAPVPTDPKKDKAATLPVMQKLLNVTDQDALSQTYDYYVTAIFPIYPELTMDVWTYSRDDLAKTNPAVKGLDLTKVIDNSFVQSAKDRKVGGS